MCLYLMSFSMHTKPLYKTSYQQIKKVETKKKFPRQPSFVNNNLSPFN